MSAHTITTMSRRMRQRRRHALALALGVCALVIPSAASAMSDYSTVNAITGAADDSSQATGDSGYASVNSIVGTSESVPVSSSGGGAESTYSSLNAITGPRADTPTFASSSPSGSGDGFDWASALVGAGASLALAALGGAALLTVRRRSTITPATS